MFLLMLSHWRRGYPCRVDPFKRSWAVCDAQVRSHLQSDERVLAVGRCADITEYGGLEAGGTARTYVMVTDRRLR
jgi:hypothetical protein